MGKGASTCERQALELNEGPKSGETLKLDAGLISALSNRIGYEGIYPEDLSRIHPNLDERKADQLVKLGFMQKHQEIWIDSDKLTTVIRYRLTPQLDKYKLQLAFESLSPEAQQLMMAYHANAEQSLSYRLEITQKELKEVTLMPTLKIKKATEELKEKGILNSGYSRKNVLTRAARLKAREINQSLKLPWQNPQEPVALTGIEPLTFPEPVKNTQGLASAEEILEKHLSDLTKFHGRLLHPNLGKHHEPELDKLVKEGYLSATKSYTLAYEDQKPKSPALQAACRYTLTDKGILAIIKTRIGNLSYTHEQAYQKLIKGSISPNGSFNLSKLMNLTAMNREDSKLLISALINENLITSSRVSGSPNLNLSKLSKSYLKLSQKSQQS